MLTKKHWISCRLVLSTLIKTCMLLPCQVSTDNRALLQFPLRLILPMLNQIWHISVIKSHEKCVPGLSHTDVCKWRPGSEATHSEWLWLTMYDSCPICSFLGIRSWRIPGLLETMSLKLEKCISFWRYCICTTTMKCTRVASECSKQFWHNPNKAAWHSWM